jgi:putative transposase
LNLRRSMPRLGTRKLYYLLKESFDKESISIGRDGLFELLRQQRLLIVKRKKYTKTTDSKHWMRRYPNLVKGLALKRPEQLWVADITYIAMKQGYCYLHLVTDAYSKQIMGYRVSENLSATATLQALKMAIDSRSYSGRLIHHSDRGLQYCSALYVKTLQAKQISISMTEDGSPYDNAIAERVNGILKDEFGLDDIFENIEQLRREVDQSVTTYNERRPHESNHMLTPNEMHQQKRLRPKLWHKKPTKTLQGSCRFLA